MSSSTSSIIAVVALSLTIATGHAEDLAFDPYAPAAAPTPIPTIMDRMLAADAGPAESPAAPWSPTAIAPLVRRAQSDEDAAQILQLSILAGSVAAVQVDVGAAKAAADSPRGFFGAIRYAFATEPFWSTAKVVGGGLAGWGLYELVDAAFASGSRTTITYNQTAGRDATAGNNNSSGASSDHNAEAAE